MNRKSYKEELLNGFEGGTPLKGNINSQVHDHEPTMTLFLVPFGVLST